jgi:hypothetical protein
MKVTNPRSAKELIETLRESIDEYEKPLRSAQLKLIQQLVNLFFRFSNSEKI